jgi:hypothetical protein
MYVTPNHIKELKENEIFVFGANRQGRHGKDFMPQPSDTAKLVGRGEEQTSDYKGMPSEFINKLKSGTLNFKSPLNKDAKVETPVGESKKWIKTYEQFRRK